LEHGSEEVDGVDKGTGASLHDDVDGVEVPLTSEAAGQVGFGVGGGVEIGTGGVQESEGSLDGLGGEVEDLFDEWRMGIWLRSWKRSRAENRAAMGHLKAVRVPVG